MKRFAIVLSLVVGAALFLSACDITVRPAPPPPDPNESVTVGTSPGSAVTSKTLASGASWLYQVTVPSAVRSSSDVVYLELNQNLDMRVRGAGRNMLYSSSSDQYFGRGVAGIATAAITGMSDLDAQAINVATECRGSCVIFQPGDQNTYFLEVTNPRSSSVTYDLFAFGDDFQDEFEPRNNSRADAAVLSVGPTFSDNGALETIGDVDFWYMNANGSVAFEAAESALGIRAELQTSGGSLIGTYQRGDTINVNAGQYLRIYSSTDRAAAAGVSVYYLSNP